MMPRNNAFPTLCLPLVAQGAVYDLVSNVGIPAEMAAGVVISSMSAAVHGLFDVAPLPSMKFPLSTIVLIVAPSGTGKTVAENKMMAGFRRFDSEMAKRYEVEFAKFQTKIDAHHAARKGILRKIKMAAASDGEKSESLAQLLAELDAKAPIAPPLPRMIYTDATLAGIQTGLQNWPVAILTSDEAAHFADNRAEDLLSLINSINSGSPIHLDTARRTMRVEDPRMAFRFQMQPGAFDRMLKKLGSRLDDEGTLARSLHVFVEPTQSRPVSLTSFQNWLATDKFNDRCFELLVASVGEDGRPVERAVLTFDGFAQQSWADEKARISSMTAPGGYLQNFPELAAKASENIARLAAIFHAFDKKEGTVSVQTVQNAESVYGWFAEEQVRIFSTPPAPPQEELDAAKLMQWLANYVRTHNQLGLPKTFLLKNGPRCTRVSVRLDAALLFLWTRGYLEERVFPESKIKHILLNPDCFHPWQIAHWCSANPGFPT